MHKRQKLNMNNYSQKRQCSRYKCSSTMRKEGEIQTGISDKSIMFTNLGGAGAEY